MMRDVEPHLAAAKNAYAKGHLDQAAEHVAAALAIARTAAALNIAGAIAAKNGDFTQAASLFDEAVSHDNNQPDIWLNWILACKMQRDYAGALTVLQQAVSACPDSGALYYQLGATLAQQEQPTEAAKAYERAAALGLSSYSLPLNQALNYATLEDYPQAEKCFIQAITLQPNATSAYIHAAKMVYNKGYYRLGHDLLLHALRLNPSDHEARNLLAFCRLRWGDFAHGWPLYQHRWHANLWTNREGRRLSIPRPLSAPVWHPTSTARRVLVHGEQGHGDCLQFLRLLWPLAAQVADVILALPAAFTRLLQHSRLPANVRLATLDLPSLDALDTSTLPEHDAQISLLDLPAYFLGSIDALRNLSPLPYLHAPAAPPLAGDFKVGLVWTGSQRLTTAEKKRSLTYDDLKPLLALPNITFYSLQRDTPPLPDARVINLAPQLHDWAATAGVMRQLDLMISIDTAPIHLAGAWGVPALLPLPHHSCWRWGLGTDASPWYPSVRLLRQQQPDDWREVIKQIVSIIQAASRGATGQLTPQNPIWQGENAPHSATTDWPLLQQYLLTNQQQNDVFASLAIAA